ncbi:hypothetical protein B0H10DRAFT_2209392 [Mycena sp. CBHHK59/15]|nr:hypothetical protein B0H10DRAFT_2209392 [Mycena sp. CBHHK59/15]
MVLISVRPRRREVRALRPSIYVLLATSHPVQHRPRCPPRIPRYGPVSPRLASPSLPTRMPMTIVAVPRLERRCEHGVHQPVPLSTRRRSERARRPANTDCARRRQASRLPAADADARVGAGAGGRGTSRDGSVRLGPCTASAAPARCASSSRDRAPAPPALCLCLSPSPALPSRTPRLGSRLAPAYPPATRAGRQTQIKRARGGVTSRAALD